MFELFYKFYCCFKHTIIKFPGIKKTEQFINKQHEIILTNTSSKEKAIQYKCLQKRFLKAATDCESLDGPVQRRGKGREGNGPNCESAREWLLNQWVMWSECSTTEKQTHKHAT